MCLPLAPVLAVVGAVTSAVSVISEIKAANYQNKAISDQLQNSYHQIADQQAAENNDRSRAARKEQGRIAVAAGEAGLQLSSGSIEGLLMDSTMQRQLSSERTGLNADNMRQQARDEANKYYSQVQQPSVVGAGLRVASGTIGGYSSGLQLQIARSNLRWAFGNRRT
jgi:hypothetical protein